MDSSVVNNLLDKFKQASGEPKPLCYPEGLKRKLDKCARQRRKQLHELDAHRIELHECGDDPAVPDEVIAFYVRSIAFLNWKINESRLKIYLIKNMIDKFYA
jgi:hypothetical protein